MNVRAGAPALAAGAICLAILGGMMVGHALPLWTGTMVRLHATPTTPQDLFRGDHVRLETPVTRLKLASDDARAPGEVTPVGRWWPSSADLRERSRGAMIYVQLETSPSGEAQPVTVSRDRVAGQLNLRGRIRTVDTDRQLHADYGIDVFYLEEGATDAIADAVRDGRRLQVELAIAANGRARIKRLNLLSEGDR
jgi:uncharacterized membrane-anchored protein